MYQIFSGLSGKVMTNLTIISKMVPSGLTGETNLLLTVHQIVKHKPMFFASSAGVILSVPMVMWGMLSFG